MFYRCDVGRVARGGARAPCPPPGRSSSPRPLTWRGGENMTTDTALHARLVEALAERDALRAQLEGDLPAATQWLQRKVWRQARALDTLNRRVTRQRFVLRTLDQLGRS